MQIFYNNIEKVGFVKYNKIWLRKTTINSRIILEKMKLIIKQFAELLQFLYYNRLGNESLVVRVGVLN